MYTRLNSVRRAGVVRAVEVFQRHTSFRDPIAAGRREHRAWIEDAGADRPEGIAMPQAHEVSQFVGCDIRRHGDVIRARLTKKLEAGLCPRQKARNVNGDSATQMAITP